MGMNHLQILVSARAAVQKAWCRNELSKKRGDDYAYCLIGSVDQTGATGKARDAALARIQEQIVNRPEWRQNYDDSDTESTIMGFNDDSKSKKRVLGVLDGAIEAAKERVGP